MCAAAAQRRFHESSFGSCLIERSCVRQLDGEAQFLFELAGVVCTFDIFLSALIGGRPADRIC